MYLFLIFRVFLCNILWAIGLLILFVEILNGRGGILWVRLLGLGVPVEAVGLGFILLEAAIHTVCLFFCILIIVLNLIFSLYSR